MSHSAVYVVGVRAERSHLLPRPVTLPTTQRNQVLHRVPLVGIVNVAGRHDVVNNMFAPEFGKMFGFGAAAMLAAGLITSPDTATFARRPPCSV